MRHLALTGLMATLLAGCGGSDKGDAAAKTAGIPLAIASAKQSETPVKVTKKLDEYPAEIRALLQRANAAVVAGRNAVAIESLCQAIGQTPEDASLFRMRADVYKLQGENASARADFSTALRLAPNDPDLWNNRGYFLMSQGLTAEALSDFNRAIQLQPAHSAALNNRGLVHLANQKMEDAEADFTKAIDADQKFVDAWNNRAFARLKLNRLAPAMDDIRQALRLDERYVSKTRLRGIVNYDINQQPNYESLLDENTIVKSGQRLLVKDRYTNTFQLVIVSPINNLTQYPLSQLQTSQLKQPLFENYYFFSYGETPIGYKQNIIDWDSKYTTISYNLSTSEEWYGDEGLLDIVFNNLLTEQLFLNK